MSSLFQYTLRDLPAFAPPAPGAPESQFSRELRNGWERGRAAGVLRYDVQQLPSRRVEGTFSYFLQMNPDRGSKRRAPDVISGVKQEFDPAKFNFSRVPPAEVALTLANAERGEQTHGVLVNVSPISELHGLLCPAVQDELPQVITEESLHTALEVYFLAEDRDLRIGFNSLCALASVNHLHYHLLREKATLPVEYVVCEHLSGPLYIFENNYPSPAYCFQLAKKSEIASTAQNIYRLIEYLLDNNIAHNLMITRGKCMERTEKDVVRIAVWPRKSSYGAKQVDAFNVAVCELSGWFPVYNKEDFEKLQELDIVRELSAWKLDNCDRVTKDIIDLYPIVNK